MNSIQKNNINVPNTTNQGTNPAIGNNQPSNKRACINTNTMNRTSQNQEQLELLKKKGMFTYTGDRSPQYKKKLTTKSFKDKYLC